MKKSYIKTLIVLTLLLTFYFGADAQEPERKTSFNDAAAALSKKEIGNLFPMNDQQVNQIIRISQKGQDITGGVNALINLGVYFGNEINQEEETVLIRASKADVGKFSEVNELIITSLMKPKTSSVAEANYILDFIEAGKGDLVVAGIKNLSKVNYRMRTGPELLINPSKLALWTDAGTLDEKQFQLVYKAMQSIGLQEELNEISATALINLVKASKPDEIIKAAATLGATGWRCEGELDFREQRVIENVINSVYAEDQIGASPLSDAGNIE